MKSRSRMLPMLAASLVVGVVSAEAKTCDEGDTRQEHHVGNFNFVTSSWVEKKGKLRRYISCVKNLDPNSDLLVTWFIAGPFQTYVPATVELPTPRLRDDISPRPVRGCIQYGNLGERTPAEFMGTADDEERNGKEGNCAPATQVGNEPQGTDLPPDGWQDDVRVFFPSDPDDPHDTMLEVTGKIGIAPIPGGVTGGGFQSFFAYSAKQYEGRKLGKVEDVTVTPVFPIKSDFFAAAFFKENKEATGLSRDGSISFDVLAPFSNAWRPAPAFYEFRDKHGRVLGAIPMPLFQSSGG
ncbi:hypothetical protein [Mesorhizobium sp. M0134]